MYILLTVLIQAYTSSCPHIANGCGIALKSRGEISTRSMQVTLYTLSDFSIIEVQTRMLTDAVFCRTLCIFSYIYSNSQLRTLTGSFTSLTTIGGNFYMYVF